ncbi:MAG: hypothetical protein MUF07_06635 [Steroidobacteraceae bacterium]|jgi:hypothetical protein|nr:hypothetical protein [Steroidobacteraceae bacterium]
MNARRALLAGVATGVLLGAAGARAGAPGAPSAASVDAVPRLEEVVVTVSDTGRLVGLRDRGWNTAWQFETLRGDDHSGQVDAYHPTPQRPVRAAGYGRSARSTASRCAGGGSRLVLEAFSAAHRGAPCTAPP